MLQSVCLAFYIYFHCQKEWTGEELTQCSLYGIRVYHTDAVLATHVDRLPLVSSAIINVAQDLDEPWYVCTIVLSALY